MPNKMLIDATHPEETRVVVLRGNRVEEFDFESANRKQLRGNIYLAKVTRVEPSLQAAFVDYGGNRHGFLAFSEIHPDYYQIPVADRQALIAEEERAQRAAEAEADRRAGRSHGGRGRAAHQPRGTVRSVPVETEAETEADIVEAEADVLAMMAGSEQVAPQAGDEEAVAHQAPSEASAADVPPEQAEETPPDIAADAPIAPAQAEGERNAGEFVRFFDDQAPVPATDAQEGNETAAPTEGVEAQPIAAEGNGAESADPADNITEVNGHGTDTEDEFVESVGGADAMEEVPERMPRLRRQYKIQEVIKRRQVMLVQVVKEERGTKGAALTTYLSLAGRYSVLMPNTARGGGISRKITSAEDRRRLKDIAQDLEVPEGMGVILRTAGASRTKTEVKRDFEYLLRLWETVRDLTLKSTAPTLVYEEGSLVKRSIRDLYNKDIDEVLVAGEESYTDAKDFMRMLMPSHAKNVKLYPEGVPIFTRHGIESQLDAMFSPVMQLKSGGYIVLNQAEALVAIDVNSGRATREHHIEDTALKTNIEAAEEIARQLRLRDLAGLIVIDFIDMEEKRNNRAVERRLKDCLRHDRARIQVGHISHFGLLEMSRQRIRSSVLESSTEKCPHCGGTGHVRSVSSVSLQLLRSLEEMLLKGATHNLVVRTRTDIALYLLNHKRAHLRALEERFRIAIMINADANVGGQLSFVIEKGEQVHSVEQAKALAAQPTTLVADEIEEDHGQEATEDDTAVEHEAEAEAIQEGAPPEGEPDLDLEDGGERPDSERNGARRRRRRRGGRRGSESPEASTLPQRQGAAPAPHDTGAVPHDQPPDFAAPEAEPAERTAGEPDEAAGAESTAESQGDAERRRRRRGRRGGRRNRRDRNGEASVAADNGEAAGPDSAAAVADLDHVALAGHEAAPEPGRSPPDDPHGHPAFLPQAAAPALPDASTAPQTGPEPQADAVQPEPQAKPSPEAPRRRSTVREPAPASLASQPAFAGEEPVPLPVQPAAPVEPAVSSATEREESDRPRRSGWWSRRVLGKE